MNGAFVVFGVVLCFVVGGAYSSEIFKDDEGCTAEEAERCGVDFIPFYVTPKLPETPKGLKYQCKRSMSQIKCYERFATKCLTGVAKGVVLFTTGAALEEYNSVCDTSSPKHKVYLDSVKCINQAGPSMQSCIQGMFVALHRASGAPASKQIPYSCCYYHEFLECGEKALTENCDDPAAKQFFDDIIDHVLEESLNVVCNKFKDTGTCENLPTLSTENDDEASEKGFIEPLAKIAENIG